MFILKIIFILLNVLGAKQVESNSDYDTVQINCKYLYIRDKISQKHMENLYTINSYRVDLNIDLFKTLESDCFTNEVNVYEFHPYSPDYVIYGVDVSNNQLQDYQLERLIKQNPLFKYNFNLIKYLNLSNNNLHLMTSKSSKTYLDNEINSMRDYLNLEPNDPGYLLNRFFRLESLIIDNNPSLSVNFRNFISILPELKVLSVNNCSSSTTEPKYASSRTAHLFYLGLQLNKLNDAIFSSLSNLVIEIFDLSGNRITDLKALLNTGLQVKQLSLENNLISSFEASYLKQNLSELDLRHNLIQNISANRFYSIEYKPSLKLFGNPLVCDCNSIWLLKEFERLKQARYLEQKPRYSLLSRKRPKSIANETIRLVFRRSLEELSAHLYTFNNQNDSEFLPRQKRIRLNDAKTMMIHLSDIDKLACSFLTASISDLKNITHGFYEQVQSHDFDYRIHYKEKLIAESKSTDFMCMYEDHCRRDECDCCDFFHCHCRSICPSKCRCYFDSEMSKNIIDCSALNLLDIDNEQPIELATDVRFNSNSLKIIKSHSFFGFTNVKYLYLQNNRISMLENECFDDLKNSLKLVNLADNHINYLSGEEFKNFTQLEILILTNNPLKQIDRLDLFTLNYMKNLKLIFLESVNISAEKLEFLDKITKLNSNAILRIDHWPKTTKIVPTSSPTIITVTTTTTTTPTTTPIATTTATTIRSTQKIILMEQITSRRQTFNRNTSKSTIKISPINNHKILTNSSSNIEKIYKFKNPFYILIFILLISIFILSIILILIVWCKKSSLEKKKTNYLNYVPKLIEQNDYQSDQYSDDSELERKKRANIFRCHRKSTCSTDSCDSTYDGQSDSVSIPVSRSIENLNVYVYFNIIDNDYVANHLLPCLKKCATLIPEPKFILKPLKTYCISQSDTMSIDWSNESYSSYYSSIYGKKANNVNAILMVLSENFLGYRRRASESYVSVRYKTNPNLYSMNSNAYMSINRSVDSYFRKAFKIYLNNGHVWCRLNTNASKKSNKKSQRDSIYMNESSNCFIDTYNSSNAFDEKLFEKLQNYFQYVCLKSNFSNFSYVDCTKK